MKGGLVGWLIGQTVLFVINEQYPKIEMMLFSLVFCIVVGMLMESKKVTK